MRTAYRDLARRLHPDRQAQTRPGERALAERRMREVNQAWTVLGNATARRRYDQALRVGDPPPPGARPAGRPASAPARPGPPKRPVEDDLVDVAPEMGPAGAMFWRALPWVAGIGVLLGIFVLTAYATGSGSDDDPAPPSPATVKATEAGPCVTVSPGPAVRAVPCDQPNNGIVVAQARDGSDCPPGTDARRITSDGLFSCLQPVRGPATSRPAPSDLSGAGG